MNVKKIVLALALGAICLQASAHRPWLLPQGTNVEHKEAWVIIDGAISEGLFDFDHVALKLDGATVTGPDGVTVPAPPAAMGRKRSSFELRMPVDGTYKISLVTRSVMGSYKDKASGELKRFRGTEESLARDVPADAGEVRITRSHARLETYVSANTTSTGALKPSGVGLEMVPVTHPTDLRTGENATWRFQLDGKPLARFELSLIPGGVRYRGVLGEQRLLTDARGEVTVKLPAAGMYWLHAAYPVAQGKGQAADGPVNAMRYSYGATLEVLPE